MGKYTQSNYITKQIIFQPLFAFLRGQNRIILGDKFSNSLDKAAKMW